MIAVFDGAQKSLKGQEIVKCPVFADIAAGCPIEMQEGLQEIFLLPSAWVSVPSETFILTVKAIP